MSLIKFNIDYILFPSSTNDSLINDNSFNSDVYEEDNLIPLKNAVEYEFENEYATPGFSKNDFEFL